MNSAFISMLNPDKAQVKASKSSTSTKADIATIALMYLATTAVIVLLTTIWVQ
ncbi:hypothetical protein [Vibrio methylphosphonaticus]|uniref:hypothetical protein n=1 Tax=Vibrio methylphosphonaticus TaxID=2946866 RepID=UPI002029FBC7|nr:hypothetical protein [Vibrio methylphosphonaticus]MCL9774130.1 hypothetical protein [Vibrio methylphosphonaticus]